MENQVKWKLVNPEGAVESESNAANPHPPCLDGKTILLRWNGKPNGDVFLDRIANLFAQKINNVRLVKAWEVLPESKNSGTNSEASKEMAANLSKFKPDICVASQGD